MTVEEVLNVGMKAYVQGAADFMHYMHDYYNGAEPIYPSEMEDILIKFFERFGEIKEINE